ncbi:hypothetical protein [Plasticicumulans lactativorans]|uniref:hypothetical protein n=1 Tax=Plasticicumulans lactativorans TaxID=1133106 RepID=UPI001048D760|nr:hypothetical protein [Plasticicumulans lactativorans]
MTKPVPPYLAEDSEAADLINQYLSHVPDWDGKVAFSNFIEAVVGPALVGLLIAALGSWLFSIDRTQQVFVFCAIAVSYAIGQMNSGTNTPQHHIALALKALVVAVYRRR